ncbi:hypothetical protein [Azonexus sp.]|uniref:hypothetical protein n=1 Tax=Azonexus sp. TaxID=1872668 RepID=UPI0027B9319E|nr:hypothetical protein [Azonexus sp.]
MAVMLIVVLPSESSARGGVQLQYQCHVEKMPHVLVPSLIQQGWGDKPLRSEVRKSGNFYGRPEKFPVYNGLTAKIGRLAFCAGLGRDPP